MSASATDTGGDVPAETNAAAFDEYAADYEEALQRGLSVSGESKDYFAEKRIEWLKGCLDRLGSASPASVLDYGCGTGSAAPFLSSILGAKDILGVDISAASVRVAAREQAGAAGARFDTLDGYRPDGAFDLAFCNGVFHHIPLPERASAVRYVHASLKPGGLFAFWENNPWNPGTRYIMSRIPFDRDAVTLTPPEARRLLEAGGFEVVQTHFLFLFPNSLRSLRKLEPPLARLPLGAQYQVLCRRS